MKSGIRNGIQQAESAIFGILHKFMQNELLVGHCHRVFLLQPYRLWRMNRTPITQGGALRYICLSHSGSPSLKSFSFSPAVTTTDANSASRAIAQAKGRMFSPKGHNIFSPGQRPAVQRAPHLPNTACKAATDIAQWKRPVVHGKRPVEYDA